MLKKKKKEWACFHGCWRKPDLCHLGLPEGLFTVVSGTFWASDSAERESENPRWKPPHHVCRTITGSVDQLGHNVKQSHTKLGTQWQPHRTIWGFWPLTKPVVLISMTFWTTVLYVSSESAREERLLERLSHRVSLHKEARRQSFWTSNWHPFL